MPSATVENYLKRIYLEQERVPGALVSLGKLADSMRVVPGTVTTMVKGLSEAGLLEYEPRQGVKLTRRGEKLALSILRKHRLLELFLFSVLHVDWAEVHDEAEELEHALSDKLLNRIDDFLGNPQFDPHGDPIPSSTGEVLERELRSLHDCRKGEGVTVAAITDQSPAFLDYARNHGIIPDAAVRIVSIDSVADAISVSTGENQTVTMGGVAARKVLVKMAEG